MSTQVIYTAEDVEQIELQFGQEIANDYRRNQDIIKHNPEHYLRIESMSHGQHHEVIQEFLESDWTTDIDRHTAASRVYYPRKSIGCWLREVKDEEAIESYQRFKAVANLKRAENYLRQNGVTAFSWG